MKTVNLTNLYIPLMIHLHYMYYSNVTRLPMKIAVILYVQL